mmetsp:Transcript_14621/g.22024  ORF Transcript_14621/g.22024 Transcript_14621/m.22024 type:complete len:226 (+) Transcript_14621:55-732(+)
MLLKRLNKLGRLTPIETLPLCARNNGLYQHSHSNITSLLCKRINTELDVWRREQQFDHVIEQKRDWMSYLVMQILFKKQTTIVTLRGYDKILFQLTTGNYCRFKRKAGLLPWSVKRSRRLHKAMAPEMIDWIIHFFKTQNINYVHLQVAGWHTIRHDILRRVFDQLQVIQFADTTKVSFSYWGMRRKQAPHVKARFRPRGTVKIGRTRLIKPKDDPIDMVEHFGQ